MEAAVEAVVEEVRTSGIGSFMPCLVHVAGRVPTLGEPLLDEYLRFTAARVRPNTLAAQAFDLKVFFGIVGKPPEQVTVTDVLGFIEAQRAPRRGGRPSSQRARTELGRPLSPAAYDLWGRMPLGWVLLAGPGALSATKPPRRMGVGSYGDRVELGPSEKMLRLRFAGTCRVCGLALPAGSHGVYDRASRSVRCERHSAVDGGGLEASAVDAGVAGASARREFDRRSAAREARVRANHPRLGGLLLAVTGEQQSIRAWQTGAAGEERLGRGLDAIAGERVQVLHDRRMPGSRANIDHVVVAPGGVYVVDAKKYRGRPRLKVEGGVLRPRVERLLVGARDRTRLVDGALRQVDVVRGLLGGEVPVQGVLCFVDADWPLLGGAFSIGGVQVCWPKKLYARLQAPGPLSAGHVGELHRELVRALPPA
ncbi:NERD domain-containing protein [Intrasporangium calvum]|uniref:NERD domain-containing protein n=1 Tax=Intrasporangium calvum TaxID=53358 RepID=A0ABT5GLJ1_9MICO|nr:nuclease-related domain-containing protein [Intrasporangium calvum]MDC5698745.1 NERD domain-containing protein [Intrasporangium calvum]